MTTLVERNLLCIATDPTDARPVFALKSGLNSRKPAKGRCDGAKNPCGETVRAKETESADWSQGGRELSREDCDVEDRLADVPVECRESFAKVSNIVGDESVVQ